MNYLYGYTIINSNKIFFKTFYNKPQNTFLRNYSKQTEKNGNRKTETNETIDTFDR